MASEDSRFPYRLVVLGFPLVGGLYLGVVIALGSAVGIPYTLGAPAGFFYTDVFRPAMLFFELEYAFEPTWAGALSFIVAWELLWLALGVVVALLAWLVSLLWSSGGSDGKGA